jgi:hypothetical protein
MAAKDTQRAASKDRRGLEGVEEGRSAEEAASRVGRRRVCGRRQRLEREEG